MKYFLQIISAIFYTCLFTGIMYLVMVLPIAFIVSLPWWGMLLILLIGGGIIEGLISVFQIIGLLPYSWIVKDNSVAMWISILLMSFNLGRSTWMLWESLIGHGFWAITIALVFSGMVLQLLISASTSIIGLKNNN